MQKQTLIVIASLALVYGCGGKGKEVAAAAPAVIATPNAAVAPISPSPQPNEPKLQAIATAPDLVTGEKVYKSTCGICHKSGLKGAPRLGNKKDKKDWELRLAQDRAILYDHAINGYVGKKGSMPSRGSNAKLSGDEVRAAVDYMVVHAIPSWEWGN